MCLLTIENMNMSNTYLLQEHIIYNDEIECWQDRREAMKEKRHSGIIVSEKLQ